MSPMFACETCEDDGWIDIPDPETGGVLGPAPCPNGCAPPPVDRDGEQ